MNLTFALLLLLLFTIVHCSAHITSGECSSEVQHCNLSATAGKPRAHHNAKVRGSNVSMVGHSTVTLFADVNTLDTGRGRE